MLWPARHLAPRSWCFVVTSAVRRLRGRFRREWESRTEPLTLTVRSARDLGIAARWRFQRDRKSAEYRAAYERARPLVSICIATYNRAELLRERSVRSVLAQTYRNIEIIVVGDACTDATAEVMAGVSDSRLRFVNLAQRGDYPADPELRWMVAGTAPFNHALSLARGDFITHLDDDDEHEPGRVQALLDHIMETRADLLYHPFQYETAADVWEINPAAAFRHGQLTTSSIFYHNWFRRIPWDPLAYQYREPGDWNRLRKIAYLGAKAVRHPSILLSHYKERNQNAQ